MQAAPSASSQFLLELLANEVDRVRRHFVHFVACQQHGHLLLAALEVAQHRKQQPGEEGNRYVCTCTYNMRREEKGKEERSKWMIV